MDDAFLQPTKEDIERTVRDIERRDCREWTKTNYKTTLKRFYKWHIGEDKRYPSQVEWIRTRKATNRKLPEDLLTQKEIEDLVEGCRNPRDKALISSLADSGCRIGEILSMRIGDVIFDDYGAVFRVTGKTGDRRVRVIGESVAYLAAWLEVHPQETNRTAPLWVGLNSETRKRPMGYPQARKVLRSAAKRARIGKRVHAHLFRHTRATQLAAKVAEAPLEVQMGWVHGSEMAKVYVHLSGKDVDRAILKAEGIEIPEDEDSDKKRKLPKPCPRCEAVNASDSRFCRRCRLPLTFESASEVGAEMEKIVPTPEGMKELRNLLDNPRVQRFLSLLDKVERPSEG
jgi:integrase